MHIKELSIAEFEVFSKNNPLGSYHQSINYALFMGENGYDYNLIGYVDELGVIKAASLILIKKINLSYKYGYAPKGFLIDYFDYDLLKSFTEDIKKYYSKQLVFIKINPEIAIGEINIYSKVPNYNHNITIRDYLKDLGYHKLKDNLYFEALIARYNGIINLDEYDFNKLNKNTKNKIKRAINKGLVFEKVNRDGIDILFNFIKKDGNINYYKNYYNIFNRNSSCDLFLIKIDYQKYLLASKNLYDQELINNTNLNSILINNSKENNINKKMNSDRVLLNYKNDIEIATNGVKNGKNTYIAGALVIKYKNRVNIVISGFSSNYKKFNANYFLHYSLIEYYKNNYKYLDLNGITGDFKDTNPYKGLNDFKLGFKPHIYEFIGEFDLIINNKKYLYLNKNGILAKEFKTK